MKAHRQRLVEALTKVREKRAQLRAEPYPRPSEQRDALDAVKEQGRAALVAIHERALRDVAVDEERNRQYRRDHDRPAVVDALTTDRVKMMLAAHKPIDLLPVVQTREEAAALRALAAARFVASLQPEQLASPAVKVALADLDRACDLRERDFLSPTARYAREEDDKLRAEVDAYLDLKGLAEREIVDGFPVTPQEMIAHGLKVGDLGLEQE